jgi:3-oxoacyl-[acyl-carrier protein] reductase
MTPRPVALVTGVGRTVGIAAAICRTLAIEGWDLVVSYWTPADHEIFGDDADDGLDELLTEVRGLGAAVTAIPVDLEDPEAPARLLREAGGVSALVLSHAWDIDSGILDTTLEQFDKHFAINTRASWLLIGEFAKQLESPTGRIVALTSDHTVGNLPYGASKGALDRIVIAAAKELAHLGITANVINPGPIDTGWMTDETRAHLTALQPTGRLGTPSDTADLVAFLLSDKGGWINGQLIKSDGGISVHG